MKKRMVVFFILSMMILTVASCFAQNPVEMVERTLHINIPTLSLLTDNNAYTQINNRLYDESYRLLKGSSVDVEQDFSDWNVIDYYSQATMTYQNSRMISFQMDQYLYPYRSAHGSHLFLGFVFDLVTGTPLTLHDLFLVNDGFIQTVNGFMNQTIKENDIPVFDFTPFKGLDDTIEFYLKESELVIVYQEYAYTPYSYGPLIFTIPLHDLTSFLNPNFF